MLTLGRFFWVFFFFATSSNSYLGSFYSEAQGVGGTHALSPLHVARLGDATLGMLLGGRPPAVHLHHFVVKVLPGFGPFTSPYQLLLQVCSVTTGERASQAGSRAGCLHTSKPVRGVEQKWLFTFRVRLSRSCERSNSFYGASVVLFGLNIKIGVTI